jgi:lipoate-protein ligase A
VSLGYFQKEDDILQDERLRNLPRVRRLTGGGTLVHDKELTYSLSLPGSQRVIEKPIDLYRLVHQAFIDVFHRRGIEAYLRGHTHRLTQEPVLCFVREDEHDIVVNGHKVLGSAQRRRRGAILQHGGLLLKASAVTPELLGIADLCPTADLSNLMDELNESVSNCLSAAFRRGSLTLSEEEAVETLIGVTQRQ